MAVFVYRTGTILNGLSASASTAVTVIPATMNDDLNTNTARVILWNTPSGQIKSLIAETTIALLANQAVQHSFTALTSAITAFSVEIRYSNPNMVPSVSIVGNEVIGATTNTGAPPRNTLFLAGGELYFNSSEAQNP